MRVPNKLEQLPTNIEITLKLRLNVVEALFLNAVALTYEHASEAGAVRQVIAYALHQGADAAPEMKTPFDLVQATSVIDPMTLEPDTRPQRLPAFKAELAEMVEQVRAARETTKH